MERLIQALRPAEPAHLIVNVDGPRSGNSTDVERVAEVRACVENISWECRVETRFHPDNQGLRKAVCEAVSYATESYGKVIVIEDDAVPGPDFLAFCESMLEHFEDSEDIAHISGYNVVPNSIIGNLAGSSRLSIYPESFAWATWQRAWSNYDESLDWGVNAPLAELAEVTGSTVRALKWRMNFCDAKADRINSWAYRWISSMWSRRQLCISPNMNLVRYAGFDGGTHTRRKARWSDLPIQSLDSLALSEEFGEYSSEIDRWIGRTVFHETFGGLADGLAVSVALEMLKLRASMRRR
jgi:hypothetical protein